MFCVEQNMSSTLLITLVIVVLASSKSQAAKILIPGSLMRGRGHTTLLSALSAELTLRGHHVTILVPSDDHVKVGEKFADSKAKTILEYPTIPVEESDYMREFRTGNKPNPGAYDSWLIITEVTREQVSYCRQLLSNTTIMKTLTEENFDLIIEDMGNGCDVLLPEALQVPFVALTASSEFLNMNYNIYGFPLELSYVISPYISRGSDNHISFWIRVKNVLVRHTLPTILTLLPSLFKSLQREFNISPDVDFYALASKAQFWLAQDSYVLESPHPGMPNWSPVGGMAAARPGRLPPEFQEFADGSCDAGFIVFSSGSIVGGFNATLSESIASVFKKLPQRVVWKHNGPTPKNLGSNTMVSPWLPQAALLAHPRACLFIGHGGLNGIYEALFHGVPMILIPQMLQDQLYNVKKVERLGVGLHLEKKLYSADLLESKIKQVLKDSSFSEKIRRYSAILQNDDPMDRAVYWVEHIIKFGGSHLRAEVFNLNFIQYNLLDVFAFFLFLILVFVLVVYFTCVSCCALCKRRSNKPKWDKTD